MRASGIDGVARPVQVDRKQVDGRKTILLAIGLRLDEQHLLGETVGGVGLLRVAVPQVVFAERHRRVLWVGAHGADGDELLHPDAARLLHELHAHHEVLVEEETRVGAVGTDATNLSGQMDDDLRTAIAVEPADGVAAHQVVRGASWHEHVGTAFLQPGDGIRPEEAGAAGNRDAHAP